MHCKRRPAARRVSTLQSSVHMHVEHLRHSICLQNGKLYAGHSIYGTVLRTVAVIFKNSLFAWPPRPHTKLVFGVGQQCRRLVMAIGCGAALQWMDGVENGCSFRRTESIRYANTTTEIDGLFRWPPLFQIPQYQFGW